MKELFTYNMERFESLVDEVDKVEGQLLCVSSNRTDFALHLLLFRIFFLIVYYLRTILRNSL